VVLLLLLLLLLVVAAAAAAAAGGAGAVAAAAAAAAAGAAAAAAAGAAAAAVAAATVAAAARCYTNACILLRWRVQALSTVCAFVFAVHDGPDTLEAPRELLFHRLPPPSHFRRLLRTRLAPLRVWWAAVALHGAAPLTRDTLWLLGATTVAPQWNAATTALGVRSALTLALGVSALASLLSLLATDADSSHMYSRVVWGWAEDPDEVSGCDFDCDLFRD
jgi:hypothetical protein